MEPKKSSPSLFSQIKTQMDAVESVEDSFSSSPIVYSRTVGRKSPFQTTVAMAEDVPSWKRVKVSEAAPCTELFDTIHTNRHNNKIFMINYR